MKGQRVLAVLLILTFVSAAVVFSVSIYANRTRSGVTAATHQSIIKSGMTIKEIEMIFGTPGTDFPLVGVRSFAWRMDDGALLAISFDRSFRAEWTFAYIPEETYMQKLIRLLPLGVFLGNGFRKI